MPEVEIDPEVDDEEVDGTRLLEVSIVAALSPLSGGVSSEDNTDRATPGGFVAPPKVSTLKAINPGDEGCDRNTLVPVDHSSTSKVFS
jgi:hypothetical protein